MCVGGITFSFQSEVPGRLSSVPAPTLLACIARLMCLCGRVLLEGTRFGRFLTLHHITVYYTLHHHDIMLHFITLHQYITSHHIALHRALPGFISLVRRRVEQFWDVIFLGVFAYD